MSARLIGTARGNGFSPHTASGTALGLFDALDRRYGLDERVDVGLRPAQRAVAALAAVHPVRDRWRQRFWLSPLGFGFLSANSRRQLQGAPRETLAVQVYGMFHTTGVPFVMYIDTTQAMARREWPEWSPYTGAGGASGSARSVTPTPAPSTSSPRAARRRAPCRRTTAWPPSA
jgi:hypothetical protein